AKEVAFVEFPDLAVGERLHGGGRCRKRCQCDQQCERGAACEGHQRGRPLVSGCRAREARRARLARGQPATPILVCWVTCAPCWPVMVVGMVRPWPHRLPLALAGRYPASTEWAPAGSFSSNVLTGASGTASN